jgi:hypothetical protein
LSRAGIARILAGAAIVIAVPLPAQACG